MIKTQRSAHYFIWLLLALLLPVGIICGWIVIPVSVHDHLLQPGRSAGLPVTVATVVKPGYTVKLRADKGKKQWQLEWAGHIALTVPSGLIYQVTTAGSSIDSALLLGRVGERGVYQFNTAPTTIDSGFHFIFYDIIHHRILDRIDLTP